VNVTVFALDPQGSGVTSVEYSIGDGAFQNYTAPFSITTEGTTLLTARATDANGNVRTTTTTAKVDTSAPHSTITPSGTPGQAGWYRSPVTVTLSGVDNAPGSGVGTIAYSVNGGAFQTYTAPFAISTQGTTRITARATDKAGNVESALPTTT